MASVVTVCHIRFVFRLLFSVVVGWWQPEAQASNAPIDADARPDQPSNTHRILAMNDVGGQLEIVVDGETHDGSPTALTSARSYGD
jgi:hypothetical protein